MKKTLIWALSRCDIAMGRYSMQRGEFLWHIKLTPKKIPTGLLCLAATPFIFCAMGGRGVGLLWANAFHSATREVWNITKPTKWQCCRRV